MKYLACGTFGFHGNDLRSIYVVRVCAKCHMGQYYKVLYIWLMKVEPTATSHLLDFTLDILELQIVMARERDFLMSLIRCLFIHSKCSYSIWKGLCAKWTCMTQNAIIEEAPQLHLFHFVATLSWNPSPRCLRCSVSFSPTRHRSSEDLYCIIHRAK